MNRVPVLISLVGEQPIPNLLPVRALNPTKALLVSTTLTARVSQNLARLLKAEADVEDLQVDAFDMHVIQSTLRACAEQRGWNPKSILFNLTGGTKPMAFAAYRLAEELRSSFVYLQSHGGRSLLYRYDFDPIRGYQRRQHHTDQDPEIPEVLTVDDYFRAHGIWDMKAAGRKPIERLIAEALASELSEVKTNVAFGGNIELDLVVRQKNQVGIAEIKCGRRQDQPRHQKRAIEQLITATEQRYLGTYTKKLLILDRVLDKNNEDLARAYRIQVIVLPSVASERLSEEDRSVLIGKFKYTLES